MMACGEEIELLSKKTPAIYKLNEKKSAIVMVARAEQQKQKGQQSALQYVKQLTIQFVSGIVLFTPSFESLIIFLPFTAPTCHDVLP